jgi:transketolase
MTLRASHDLMANAVRALAMDAVEAAKSGHPGLPMGAADVATVLFRDHLVFDPADPTWPDRDRFVLSAGHGSMLIYALLHLIGVKGVAIDDLKAFRQLGSKTPGHPEVGHTPGVETTTGPLGQGIANAVGMAMAERLLAARHGGRLVDHYTYALVGDGCLMEGISQEAIGLAGHLRLNRLIVLWDDNNITIDGKVSLADSTDQVKRFEASGWRAERVDGHDPEAISAAIARAKKSDRPSMIACKTVIGFGAPSKAGSEKVHGAPLGAEELAATKQALNWPHGPFVVPKEAYDLWQATGRRGAQAHKAWAERLAATGAKKRAGFTRAMAGELSRELTRALKAFKKKAAGETAEIATRKTSEMTIDVIAGAAEEFVSGSADLTHSNFTQGKKLKPVQANAFGGGYIHYGIREHAMAAAMNGMALHGGLIPAGGTFFVFSDYCRPSLRLAALMGLRVIHVMTHDSIGVGEDGPTHQPVEHLAALRAMPNIAVLRPADLTETIEAYEVALGARTRPSVLALSRQNLPQLRKTYTTRNLSALGAYELVPAEGKAAVSLFASGSEVALAIEARRLLAAQGIDARVVSVPSHDLFAEQPESYRRKVIGRARVKVGIEAGVRQGWDFIIGSDGLFIGMNGFGASGPAAKVYQHFGITAAGVAEAAAARLAR